MIIIPTIFEKATTMKDKSLKISLVTQELVKEDLAELFSFNQKMVYTGFKETEIDRDELDISKLPIAKKTAKTPSQRLRNALYVYWEQNKPTDQFETFYERKVNEFIDIIKERLT